jgi:hypothetical protein
VIPTRRRRLGTIVPSALKLTIAGAVVAASYFAGSVTPGHGNAPALAQTSVGKGVLILRRGAADTKANYDKEDRDPNDKLMDVSVQCDPKTKFPSDATKIAHLKGRTGIGASMTANSTTFINAGAKITTSPTKDNPLHCTIDSVKIGDATGAFR